ncbi:hypothetical protein D3C78_1151880 [compost metagenome]
MEEARVVEVGGLRAVRQDVDDVVGCSGLAAQLVEAYHPFEVLERARAVGDAAQAHPERRQQAGDLAADLAGADDQQLAPEQAAGNPRVPLPLALAFPAAAQLLFVLQQVGEQVLGDRLAEHADGAAQPVVARQVRRQQRPVARPGRLQPLRAQPGAQQRRQPVRFAQPDRAAAQCLRRGVRLDQLEIAAQGMQRGAQFRVAGIGEQNGAHRGTSSRSVGSSSRIYAACPAGSSPRPTPTARTRRAADEGIATQPNRPRITK